MKEVFCIRLTDKHCLTDVDSLGLLVVETDNNLFHVMKNTRPMRRFKADDVPDVLMEEILDAACCAPNSMNGQPYRFILLRDKAEKNWFGDAYSKAMEERFIPHLPSEKDQSKKARNIRSAMNLGENLKVAPLLLLICGERDWPFATPLEQRVGLAPPSFGSVFPCIQNILLACRAKGLGSCLTTIHQIFEGELCQRLGIPDSYGIVAVLPIGYPLGKFGPVGRRPSRELTFYERWNVART